MTVREGSLEAPTRHPLDWQNPEFYDQAKAREGARARLRHLPRLPAVREPVHRVSDAVRPGGRLVHAGGGRRREERLREGRGPVLPVRHVLHDEVPVRSAAPLERRLPAPHAARQGGEVPAGRRRRFRDRLLSSTDAMGKLAAIPVVAQTVNAVNKNAARAQRDAERARRAQGPRAAAVSRPQQVPFRTRAASKPRAARTASITPGKVAIFSTCYVNYNEPGMGHDLLALLEHNEIPYVLVEKEACCGMPKLELGDLESVDALKKKNIPVLAKLAKDGYAILTPVPSCTLMFKQELPLMYPQRRGHHRGARRDVRSVRVLCVARQGRAAEDGFQACARQGLVPHPLPLARAEHGPEDARDARGGAGHPGDHGRALRRPRRHLGREGRVLRQLDEDRPPGVPADERAAPRTTSARTARSPRATSCRASASRRSRPRRPTR